MNVTDGMFCLNGTTSAPKSVLHYVVDKVKHKQAEQVYREIDNVDNQRKKRPKQTKRT